MNIKTQRESIGITQEKLAEEMNIDRSTVAKWETGQSMPRADKLKRLAEILDCTVDELLADENKPA